MCTIRIRYISLLCIQRRYVIIKTRHVRIFHFLSLSFLFRISSYNVTTTMMTTMTIIIIIIINTLASNKVGRRKNIYENVIIFVHRDYSGDPTWSYAYRYTRVLLLLCCMSSVLYTYLNAFAFYTVHDTERWSQVREPHGPDFFELFAELTF